MRADNHSTEMPNEQARPDGCGWRDVEAVFESVVMVEDSVVDIAEYAERLLPGAVEGELAKVIGEAKTGFQIGGQKCAFTCFARVAVSIGAQGFA